MENSNSKIITISFLTFAGLVGFAVATLLRVFSGAFGFVAKAISYDIVKHGIPVMLAVGLFLYLQLNKKTLVWSEEVIAEIKKVVWPPIKDTRGMTIVVVVMVLISSAIVSFFDMFSGYVLNLLMK